MNCHQRCELRRYSRRVNSDAFIDDLRRRLLTEESDDAIRTDIRDLVVATLSNDRQPLSYCMKESWSRAIAALQGNARSPGTGLAHPRLRFALLQCQLAMVGEDDRDESHAHPDEIIDALTRDMLLEGARGVR